MADSNIDRIRMLDCWGIVFHKTIFGKLDRSSLCEFLWRLISGGFTCHQYSNYSSKARRASIPNKKIMLMQNPLSATTFARCFQLGFSPFFATFILNGSASKRTIAFVCTRRLYVRHWYSCVGCMHTPEYAAINYL